MKDIFLLTLFLSIVAYLLQTILIYVGTYRLIFTRAEKLAKISILVALRNEERTIDACVKSLLNLDYPNELFEIVLINDRSTDQTPHIIEDLKKRSPLIWTLHIHRAIPGLSGKANAIAQGMELATGDIILVTDGDCRVPPGWAKAHAAYYENDVGLVAGFTLLDEKHDRTPLFGKIQSLDWAYLLSIGSGAIGLGKPLSVLGNNFSFRRQAYEAVGGYRNMGFTIIEDFALMKTLLQKTSWRVLYPIDADMVVYSHPMPSLKKFYHQRKRWSAGGKEVGPYGKFLMALAMMVHLMLLISFFILPPLYPIVGLVLILSADFSLLWRTTGLVNRRNLLKYFPLWEVFYFFYTIFFTPVLLLPTTVVWKDTSYTWKFNWKMKKMAERV